jgi:hypothetical protein
MTSDVLDIQTMCDIADLANEISSGKPISAEEMNRRVAAIAEEVWLHGSVVFEQLYQHVVRRTDDGHPSRRNDAYVALMRFRNRPE